MQYLILAPRKLEDVASGELRRKNIKVAKSQYRKIIIDYSHNTLWYNINDPANNFWGFGKLFLPPWIT